MAYHSQGDAKAILSILARPNYRGYGTTQIVLDLQEARDSLKRAEGGALRILLGIDEAVEKEHIFFWEQKVLSFEEEIERRRKLQYEGVAHTNKEIIQAIKERIPIEDVLERYTDVFYNSGKKWSYRCTLHGPDRHPSGVIYPDEKRCWCFVCEKGGDVFDVVQLFERVTLPQAIVELARSIGLALKPLSPKRLPGSVPLP